MTKLIVFITAIASVGFFIACSNNSMTNATNTPNTTVTTGKTPMPTIATPVPSNASSTTAGSTDEMASARDLYVKNCANCHKESGEGGPTVVDGRKMKPDNLTDDRRKKLSDDKYVKVMVEGVEDEGMPSFKDKLTEAQMRDIVKYIRIALQHQDLPPASAATGLDTNSKPPTK